MLTGNKISLTPIGHLVQFYLGILNDMKALHRFILIKCYIDKQKDILTMMEIPYEIAQFKRIKKHAVLSLAEKLEMIVEKISYRRKKICTTGCIFPVFMVY